MAASRTSPAQLLTAGPDDVLAGMHLDAIVIGSGIGGLVTATQLAAKGARVLVLERYLIPGGSAGSFDRQGYRFDVGASMIFGFGKKGNTNLLTRALAAVGEVQETIPDSSQLNYHLPEGIELAVDRDYDSWIARLTARFPAEEAGIKAFYGSCWQVFNCLDAIPLKSLEEPRYLVEVFFRNPLACLGLARWLPVNVGDLARRHLRDPRLLRLIDMECFCWSVVPADLTPMINAGMVFSDRHAGGINYPRGGVGEIARKLVRGLARHGGAIRYRARVTRVLLEQGRASGVVLADGGILRARRVVSNATRWDTFGKLVDAAHTPRRELVWRRRYKASPSFLSLHLGVRGSVISPGTACHHLLLESWEQMMAEQGTVFVSIPTLMDPGLAPPGRHIVHSFAPSALEHWKGLTPSAYKAEKQACADRLIQRLERLFPGLGAAVELLEVGTPRTHRRFLGRDKGSYGPVPAMRLPGLLPMPFNRTGLPGLYCVGDSCFPGQGLNAVAFSGFACAHRIGADLGLN